MKKTIYQTEPKKVQAWNSETTFSDSAYEVSREQRESAEARIAAMIAETKKSISEKD